MKSRKAVSSFFSLLFVIGLFAIGGTTTAVAQGGCTDEDKDGYYTSDCADQRLNFKGVETQICDCPNLTPGVMPCASEAALYEIFDYIEDANGKRGRNFNPGVPEVAGDGIDQNCDGVDGSIGDVNDRSLADLIDIGVTFLSSIVAGVSVLVLIWGAIMYATAAGEEEKTRKARKAMIGAVVGLIVGLLAPQLIKLVMQQLT